MELRNLGKSGLRVSVVGLGCNNFGWTMDIEATRRVVHKCFDVGITLFDTADIYGGSGGSEEALGQILGDHRKDIVLATKFGMAMDQTGTKKGGSRRYIMTAVEDSLRRLRTDYIDLYQLHAPDPLTPIEETLRALDDLITQGKVRYIGCSNLPAWQVVEAQWTSKSLGINSFVSVQDEYNLMNRALDRDLLPAAQAYGMGLLPYFPLASGLLTGKYRAGAKPPEGSRLTQAYFADRYLTEANLAAADKLRGYAESRGHTLLELAFSWLAARPTVASVIAGATKPEQVEANAGAATWKLTAEELAEIDGLTQG